MKKNTRSNNILTYGIILWCRVLLDKLTGTQLFKKIKWLIKWDNGNICHVMKPQQVPCAVKCFD